MKEKLRALGRRWPWFGRVLDVQDRVGEINGGFAASAITVIVLRRRCSRCCSWPSPSSASSPPATTTSPAGPHRQPGPHRARRRDHAPTPSRRRPRAARRPSIIGLLGLAWAGSAVAVALQQGVRLPVAGALARASGPAARHGLAGVAGHRVRRGHRPRRRPQLPARQVPAVAGRRCRRSWSGLAVEIGLFCVDVLGPRHPAGRRPGPAPGAIVAAVGFEVLEAGRARSTSRSWSAGRRRSTARSGSCSPSSPGWPSSPGCSCTRRRSTPSSTRPARAPSQVPIHVPRLPGADPVGRHPRRRRSLDQHRRRHPGRAHPGTGQRRRRVATSLDEPLATRGVTGATATLDRCLAADRAIAALAKLADAVPDGERREPAGGDGRRGGRRHRRAPPPAGPGRHRHRQELAYLVPAILAGQAHRRGHRHQGAAGPAGRQGPARSSRSTSARPFDFAVLKGRSNYVCQQRHRRDLRRRPAGARRAGRPGLAHRAGRAQAVGRARPPPATGPSCPSSRRPRRGRRSACRPRSAPAPASAPGRRLLRRARPPPGRRGRRGGGQHPPLGLDLATDGAVLPEHDVVVVDEAHQLEDIVSDTCGFELVGRPLPEPGPVGAGHPRRPAARSTTSRPRPSLLSAVLSRARRPAAQGRARPRHRRRPRAHPRPARPGGQRPAGHPRRRRRRRRHPQGPGRAAHHRRSWSTSPPPLDVPATSVAWVEGPDQQPDAAGGARSTWPSCSATGSGTAGPAVLTSATLPPGLAERLGLAGRRPRRARRRQPVRLRAPTASSTAPPTCPTPASGSYEAGAARRARRAHRRPPAAAPSPCSPATGPWTPPSRRCGRRLPGPVLSQRDLPKPALVAALRRRRVGLPVRHHGLLAGHRRARAARCRSSPSTGCRSPGPTSRCSRPAASGPGPTPSGSIDLPRAATLLAQGAGRLIRSAHRPRRRRRARPPPGQGQALPLGPARRPPADAPHQGPRRGRGVPHADDSPPTDAWSRRRRQ